MVQRSASKVDPVPHVLDGTDYIDYKEEKEVFSCGNILFDLKGNIIP